MIGTKARNFHLRLDLRGALMNWHDSEWRNCCKDDSGKTMTPAEVKASFLDELAKGRKYIPLGDCPDFDYEKGCPGHPVEDEDGGQGPVQDLLKATEV